MSIEKQPQNVLNSSIKILNSLQFKPSFATFANFLKLILNYYYIKVNNAYFFD